MYTMKGKVISTTVRSVRRNLKLQLLLQSLTAAGASVDRRLYRHSETDWHQNSFVTIFIYRNDGTWRQPGPLWR